MMVIIMLLDIDIGSLMVFHCDVRIGQYSMDKVVRWYKVDEYMLK